MASLPMTKCPKCEKLEPPVGRHCRTCQQDLGFPNVRHAEWEKETTALAIRYDHAMSVAEMQGCGAQITSFEAAVSKSSAVLAMWLGPLHSLLLNDRTSHQTHHTRVRSGGLLPKADEYDPYRLAAETTIHPFYYDRLHYTALSVDGRGVPAYGNYFLTLREPLIADRTTVFEKNPFRFNEEHQILAGHPPPLGFRATWPQRGKLAIAKLGKFLKPDISSSDFPSILLRPGTSTGDGDWIEALVYGDFDARTIARIVGPAPSVDSEVILWSECKAAADRYGIEVTEA